MKNIFERIKETEEEKGERFVKSFGDVYGLADINLIVQKLNDIIIEIEKRVSTLEKKTDKIK